MADDQTCKEKKTLGVKWTFTKEVSIGSIVSWFLVLGSAFAGVFTYIEETNQTATTAAKQANAVAEQASDLAEQFLYSSRETTATLKIISDQLSSVRERLGVVEIRITRIEQTQDADLQNLRSLNQRFGIPTAPPPPKPPLPKE